MRLCVWLMPALVACSHTHARPSGPDPDPGQDDPPSSSFGPGRPAPAVREASPASQPESDREGLRALSKWARECYELGLRHDPVFAKGGSLLIRWQADRRGNLLFMDFVTDSFRGWAVSPGGETLAECVVRRAREARPAVTWSSTGSAPLRLSPQ